MDEQRPESQSTPRVPRALEEFVARVTPGLPDRTAQLDEVAAEILDGYAAAGVDALLLKGAAFTRLLYAADEQRAYTDVDLLVNPDHLATARKVLAEFGYRNRSEGLGVDDVSGVVHEEIWFAGEHGSERELLPVELHRRMAGASASPQDTWRSLAARRTSIHLHGRDVPVLAPEGQAMHLALHAAQHGPKYPRGLQELTLGLERCPFETWEAAATLAEEIGATRTFSAGLRLLPEGSRLAETLGLAADHQLDWEIRHRAIRPRGTFHLQALVDAQGVSGRLNVVRRALFPTPQWLARHYRWARPSGPRLLAAYVVHFARAPLWAARAWSFRRRARRAAS